MEPSAVFRSVRGGVELDVSVVPKAKSSGIQGVDVWRKRLLVRVRAPPTEGKANRDVVELLSKAFNSDVSLIRGETSRQKTVFISLDLETAVKRLEALI